MTKCDISFPLPLPDDPRKWAGWNNYDSSNFYERLCLDPHSNPSNELIEEHCRELLRWWQKKLPLKNQPSNPLAQMLRSGLDESSRFLTEARVELLDPDRRQVIDEQMAAQKHDAATDEFRKYFHFATANGILTEEEEENLKRFGTSHGLSEGQTALLIEDELKENGIERSKPAPPPEPVVAPVTNSGSATTASPQEEFMRLLRLSNLDSSTMSDDQRDTFIDMAENLGLDPGEAEDMVDVFLEEADAKAFAPPPPVATAAKTNVAQKSTAKGADKAAPAVRRIEINPGAERSQFSNFENSIGTQMFFIPSGKFDMGSDAFDALPNERPLTRVTLSRFHIARHPVTNAQYELFDPSHKRKRAPEAGPKHPVIYVSNQDAMKFCQWLGAREKKKYRLPTEAEWEYAAKGSDNRKYPWGGYESRGNLANFADKNTMFAWSDPNVDCGYAETSPVGAFPLGASPFGIEDMAGNVWEWCLDYYEPYRGGERVNPRGAASGTKRVYRGGSWKSRFTSLRTTTRGSNIPSFSCNDLGFRLVCECD